MEFSTSTDLMSNIAFMHWRRDKLIQVELRKTLLYYLFSKFSAKLSLNGPTLEVPYGYGPEAIGRWIAPGDELPDAGPRPRGTMGFVNNRLLAIPSAYDELEWDLVRSSPALFINTMSLNDANVAWATQRMFGSAVWNGIGGVEPDGIMTQIEKAVPGSQTASPVNLSKATYWFMRNPYVQLTTNAGVTSPNYSMASGITALRSLIRSCSKGTYRPTHLICDQDTFNNLRTIFEQLHGAAGLVGSAKDLNTGFETFMIDSVEIGWDSYCPEDTVLCFHLAPARQSKWLNNMSGDSAVVDREFEEAPGVSSIYDLTSNINVISHPNFVKKKIGPRASARNGTLQITWMIYSYNIAIFQPSMVGIAGSDNGKRWRSYYEDAA